MFLEKIGHDTQSRSGVLSRSARGASGLGLMLLLSLPVSAGSLGIGADIGGISADVGVGRGGIGASVGIGGSGGSGGSRGNSGGGISADVGIGGGGISASVGIGGTGGGTTPGDVDPDGDTPGDVGMDDDTSDIGGLVASTAGTLSPAVGPKGKMPCAKDGNVSAFNGFVVRDRNGSAIGWVNDATMSNDQKIDTLRIQSTGKACYRLTGGNFTVRNGELWANVNAASFK